MDGLSLTPGCVDLWHVDPERVDEPELLDRYRALLSEDERAEGGRLVHGRDRHDFLVRRALLRTVLSQYADCDPRAWVFRRNDYGKPSVATHQGDMEHAPPNGRAGLPLGFNASHTRGLAVCAVTAGCEVGVDVEDLHRRVEALDLARRYFAAAEVKALEELPPDGRRIAFFQLWTLKEAYIKARGMGLSIPLDQFALTLSAEQPPVISLAGTCPDDPAQWQFAQIRLADRHQIAVAVRFSGPERLTIRMRETVPSGRRSEWKVLPANAFNAWFI
jgi:4'-phosphopantetheinyl transferase